MLQTSRDNARYCFLRANDCHERALGTNDLVLKDSMLTAEEGWIRLAHSYELTERLSDFMAETRKNIRK